MQLYNLSKTDYAKIKVSARHHFIHENSTSVSPDGSYNMFLSPHVAKMLALDLSVNAKLLSNEMKHPEDAVILSDEELRNSALNAPGFNLGDVPPTLVNPGVR